MEAVISDRISILIPAKNAGQTLRACLFSILEQSYSDWEVFLIDDDSKDGTWDIASEFSVIDPRFICVKNEGKGIIEALKTGYGHATGQYIHRMDSDDLMTVHKLKHLHQGLIKEKSDICIGRVKYFSAHLGDGYKKYERWLNTMDHSSLWNEIFLECCIPSPCWLMHRNCFSSYIQNQELQYPEDYALAFIAFTQSWNVSIANHYVHLWRDHPNRASRNDAHYADPHFLELKMAFFMKYFYQDNKQLVLLGSGNKAKKLARMLIDHGLSFSWLTNSRNRIGKGIYAIRIESIENYKANNPQEEQVLIGISAPPDREEIIKKLWVQGYKYNQSLFPFY